MAYAGPETSVRDRASYVLEQGKVRFVLTTPLRPDGEIAEHVRVHGDGVRDVALWVDDARQAWKETTKRGARSVREPFELKDAQGMVRIASIAAYGDTIHTFVERGDYNGPFLPGYRRMPEDPLARPTGLLHIDHMVGNVGWNEMNRWVEFYANTMGFSLYQHFDDKDISTEYSALMSKVMANGNGRVKFPINEPAEGRKKSQIEEYLEFYHGPGVQHIALATDDILQTVAKLQQQGMEFLHRAAHLLHGAGGEGREDRRADRGVGEAGHPGGSRRRGLHAADFHASRLKTARRCSTKSFSARAAAVSAKGTSRRCLKPLSASRRREAIFSSALQAS